ncbi:hypothetical protein AAZV13_02G214300 [Glycine max]
MSSKLVGQAEIEMISTPSAIASLNAARASTSGQPILIQHALYIGRRADGTHPPRAVPEANPSRLADLTKFPAIVDAVCDPWPSASLGDIISSLELAPSILKYLAPIILLHNS